jgi:methyl-accepting chemotaxis protein
MFSKRHWFNWLVGFNLVWIIATVVLSGIGEVRQAAVENILVSVAVIIPCFLSLLLYHVLLRSSAAPLSARDVDSVYYAGFLITLLVLIASVYEVAVAIGQKTESGRLLQLVGSKFALGLMVTGYGLFARISLQGQLMSEDSALDSLNKYTDNIGILNDRIRETADILAGKMFGLLADVAGIVDGASKAGRESTTEIVKVLNEELSPAATQLRQTMVKVNRSFDKLDHEQVSQFVDDLRRLSEGIAALQSATVPATQSLHQTVEAQQALVAATGRVSNAFGEVPASFTRLSEAIDPSIARFRSLVAVIESISASAGQFQSVGDSFATVAERITQSSDELCGRLEASGEAVDRFTAGLNPKRVEEFSAEMARVAQSSSAIAKEMRTLSNELPGLTNRAVAAIRQQAQDIEATTRTMNAATDRLGTAMAKLAREIGDAADFAGRR